MYRYPPLKYGKGIGRYDTFCCALAQLSLNNFHSEKDIMKVIEKMKKESEPKVVPYTSAGGERAVFVITTMPNEKPLAERLEKLGFTKVFSFERRRGYPAGYNDMWMLSW